ncbi:unnamed protein product [Caenorhabditis angaria]|uniref:SXP/RAL-2 family protein Ani s 5-like cation-binding domain-containing protein n=1 Tax=Caenorhabditis angaria TaxID=860376 RepID=A0A9P1N9R0_9PELO|nr:unnamed protein product [Caenorhabditis angaria]
MIKILWVIFVVAVFGRDVPMNGPFGAMRKPPLPIFLLNVPEDVKNEYYDLLGNSQLTIAELKNGIEHLAAENNVLDEYYAHEDQDSYTKHWLSTQLDEILKKLPETKSEIDKVMNDNQLTTVLQNKKMFDLNRKYPTEIAIINYIVNQVLVTATTRQGQITTANKILGGSKPFGDFDKAGENRDKVPK